RLHLRTGLLRDARQDLGSEIPDPAEVVECRSPALRETSGEVGRDARGLDLSGHLVEEHGPEDRTGEREPNGSADLLEEGQAARCRPELTRWHRVLHDEGEDRKRWSDPDAGYRHPEPDELRR